MSAAQEEAHTCYSKSDQEPMIGELIGTEGDPITNTW